MRTLVIDDMRVLHEVVEEELGEITYARNDRVGWRELLENGPWDHVVLDHDLGIDPNTFEKVDIRPLVEKIAQAADKCELHFVHYWSISSNPWGRRWVVDTLTDAGLWCAPRNFPCKLHRFTGERAAD